MSLYGVIDRVLPMTNLGSLVKHGLAIRIEVSHQFRKGLLLV